MVRLPIQKELWGLSAILLLGALFVSPGFFSIDESIYYLGARAVAEHGTLGIDNNGYAQFHSKALKLEILVDGPQGLTPQYPAGSALLAALLLPIMGARAFIVLNALAAVLVIFTVRKICLSQFKSEKVTWIAVALLLGGTFWTEYAVGIWPHVLAVYFSTQAFWLALHHLDIDDKGNRNVILSGLFAGSGMLFRLDAAFAVPAIGLIMVMFAPRIVRSSLCFAAGVLPSLALASALNYLKFGSPNPLSYGEGGGNTNLSAHGPLFAALCVGLAALVILRKVEWRVDRKFAIASLVVLAGALLFIPATNGWLLRGWNGFLSLVVDARNIDDHRIGVQEGPGHTVMFWGLVKKSLGQSMPWIGLAAILLTSRVQESERRSLAALVIFIATMTAPFILLSWHGGAASNMRYFLPVLPPLCILCAKLFYDLWRSVRHAAAFTVAGASAAIGLSAGWILIHPSGYVGVQQILSTYVLLATTLAAITAGTSWRFEQAGRRLAVTLLGSGLVLSVIFALTDFAVAVQRRATAYSIGISLADLPAKSLVIVFPGWVAHRLPGNGSIVAMRDSSTNRTDPRLIVDALDAGYRVFIANNGFDVARDVPPGVESSETDYAYPGGRMIELRRRSTIQQSLDLKRISAG